MKASVIFIFSFIHLFCYAENNRSQNQIYFYEPSIVSLSGKVHKQTFPGRPNYQDVGSGDRLETHWILHLENPISVLPKEGKTLDGLNSPEYNVRNVQIVIMSEYPFSFENGNRYKIVGTLFHAISGHHHTLVLVELKNAEEMK